MNQNRSTIIVGAILILVGLAFLVGQSLDLVQIELVWPMIIIAAGAAFFIGMFLGGKATGALAIPGSIITMVGLTAGGNPGRMPGRSLWPRSASEC